MKILLVNKFLYRKGGAEEYIFQLASLLRANGHEVCFWGMRDKRNIVLDDLNCFADNIDFSSATCFKRFSSALNTIYSIKNREKIITILDSFKPDIVHLHNFNFQLTPSILPQIKSKNIKIVYTAHDPQLVCPVHRFYNYQKRAICTKCIGNKFHNCIIDKCFNDSYLNSFIGAMESYFYHWLKFYSKYFNAIISPSNFLSNYLIPYKKVPVCVVPNFTQDYLGEESPIESDYILYFGRISEEKGIVELVSYSIWKRYRLIVIGDGPCKNSLISNSNIIYLGPKYGDELYQYIKSARFVIQPSQWFENCPMTVIESFMCGTPVIASNAGGFKEMIEDGSNGFLLDFSEKTIEKSLENIFSINENILRNECRVTYERAYSPEVHLSKILKIYNGVLDESISAS